MRGGVRGRKVIKKKKRSTQKCAKIIMTKSDTKSCFSLNLRAQTTVTAHRHTRELSGAETAETDFELLTLALYKIFVTTSLLVITARWL